MAKASPPSATLASCSSSRRVYALARSRGGGGVDVVGRGVCGGDVAVGSQAAAEIARILRQVQAVKGSMC